VTVAAVANIAWAQGEDPVFQFTIRDSAGAVEDITGWTWKFETRRRVEDTPAVLAKTTAGGGVVMVNGPGGVVEVRILSADTPVGGAIPPDVYKYGLVRTDAGFKRVRYEGEARLELSPVRP
jgi:hypothetical protein